MTEIPLTLWGYIYGDLEVKVGKSYNKLQRMNSISSSKMSKKSLNENKELKTLKEEIKEEFIEDSFEQEE